MSAMDALQSRAALSLRGPTPDFAASRRRLPRRVLADSGRAIWRALAALLASLLASLWVTCPALSRDLRGGATSGSGPEKGARARRRPAGWMRQGLALGVGLWLTGCSLAPREPDPTWSVAEAVLPSRRLGLEMAAQAFESGGYQIGTGIDPKALSVASQWRTSLAPFRGKGNRKRAEARLTALEDGRYKLQVRVQCQANMNLSDPLDVGQAEWEWRPEDTVAADILLQKILALLGAPLRQE
jgi:hypothetical protein